MSERQILERDKCCLLQVAEVEAAEKVKMKEKVDKILKHNINCFINRQLIYNYPEELFAEAGVMAIEHADFDGIERLALVLGGEISSTFDDPENTVLGEAGLIEEIMIGEDRLIKFSQVKAGEACTVVLRGASGHVLDEAERSLHDALCVLTTLVKDPRMVHGGGCAEMAMAVAVDELAARTPGKSALAVEAYARALRSLPATIADNAGLDSAELVSQLRAAHSKGQHRHGIDVFAARVGEMSELGVLDAFRVKENFVLAATDAAEMILRVDDIVKCAPRPRDG